MDTRSIPAAGSDLPSGPESGLPFGPESLRIVVVQNDDFELLGADDPTCGRAASADVLEVAGHVERTLSAAGHDVLRLSVRESLRGLVARLRGAGAQVVFNLVESLGGTGAREPELPRLLEREGIPFTGNRGACLRLAHAKDRVRPVLLRAGVPVPAGFVAAGSAEAALRFRRRALDGPMFVKPARADGSVGIDAGSRVESAEAALERLRWLEARLAGPYLVEEYLPGPEINVAFLPEAGRLRAAVAFMDYSGCPEGTTPFVTYGSKWDPADPGYASCSTPIGERFPPDRARQFEAVARAAFSAVGGTSVGRVDMRLDALGEPRVVDVNPNPDLHPAAGFQRAVGALGVDFGGVLARLVEAALAEGRDARSHAHAR